MRRPIVLRTLAAEEVAQIKHLVNSRTKEIRLVQRARIIAFMIEGPKIYATEASIKAGFSSPITVLTWVRRFNEEGIKGLEDKKRPGRKPIHSQGIRIAFVGLAQQKPETLGYPYYLWTLKRLQTAFKEREGVHLSDSTIWEWVESEGFKWKRQGSWFRKAEKHDPEFMEKRGAS